MIHVNSGQAPVHDARQQGDVRFVRGVHLAPLIVFIDGIAGSGKSMLGPIIGSFERVEKYRLDDFYEHIAILHRFGAIRTDAAISMLRMHADEAIYNASISREVNFRLHDNTGLLNNPFPFRFIARLFAKDGPAAMERIRTTRPVLQVNTHQMLAAGRIIFAAYQDRLRVLQMVRHPVFVVHHWLYYDSERYGTDPREFSLWIETGDAGMVPWFAVGWEREFKRLHRADRAVLLVEWLARERDATLAALSTEERERVALIPFERFVTEPWPFLRQIEAFVGTKRTRATARVLKRQSCPREVLTTGRGKARGEAHGTDPAATNRSEFLRIKGIVERDASDESKSVLRRMSDQYESACGVHFD